MQALKRKKDKYAGEVVKIKVVTARVSLFGYDGFKVRDKIGEIFMTYGGMGDIPAVGSDVKVTGIVRTDYFILIAGKTWSEA